MAAQLRFNSQAKPVRIRIKSGGEEHSTLGSLCKSFCVIDILDLLAGERLEKWLQRQLNNIENDKIKDVRDLKKIEEHIKSFKDTYKDALSDEERWKQQYTQEDVHIRLMRCFFEMDDAIQTFDQAIKWFQKHDFDHNATLVLNEDMFASHVDLAIYGYKHRDHLAIPLTKTWTEILSHHNTHPKAVWLLSKELDAIGEQMLAIQTASKAEKLGSDEATAFLNHELSDEAIQNAKENDEEIIKASVLYKNIFPSEKYMRQDFGFAKWIIRYHLQQYNHLNSESLMTIMESYGSEGLMWLGDELRETTDYVRIQCYKKAAKLGHDRAKSIVSQYREEVTGKTIPDVKINEFLRDPWTLPKLDECITNADIRSDFENLFKLVGTILTDAKYKETVHCSDVPNIIQRGLKSIGVEQNVMAMSEPIGIKHKWISEEIEFIKALKKWYETQDKNVAFKNLANKEYIPAQQILEMEKCYFKKEESTYYYTTSHNSSYNRMSFTFETITIQEKRRLEWNVFYNIHKALKNSTGWFNHNLNQMLFYFMLHFKEYRKNQYQDV